MCHTSIVQQQKAVIVTSFLFQLPCFGLLFGMQKICRCLCILQNSSTPKHLSKTMSVPSSSSRQDGYLDMYEQIMT